jgi:hypothetical protein
LNKHIAKWQNFSQTGPTAEKRTKAGQDKTAKMFFFSTAKEKHSSVESVRLPPPQGCQIFLGIKRGEIYQITTTLPMGHKIGIPKIYHHFAFYVRPSKIYPQWDFWFENIPSGNPTPPLHQCRQVSTIIIRQSTSNVKP